MRPKNPQIGEGAGLDERFTKLLEDSRKEKVDHKMVVNVEPSFHKAIQMYVSGYYISPAAWVRMVIEKAMKHGW